MIFYRLNVFQQHFTCFSHVFVNLDRVKISQIPYKSYIYQSTRQYLLSDSCSNKESDTLEVWLSPQLRCFAACSGFRTVGPATRNLWGRWEVCYAHSGAASQLAVGFGRSVPLCGTYGVRCEMRYVMYVLHCVMCEMRSVLEGHVYMKPTASCGAAQLWV